MKSPPYQPRRARGYTLLEMMIVVAILATLVAIILPAMRGPLSRSELTDAARQIRAQLARARLEAIESGVVQQFRFQPGKRLFEVGPKSISAGGDELPFTGGHSTRRLSPADQHEQLQPVRHRLPAGIYFYDQQSPERPTSDVESTDRGDSEKWSRPIMFYPNGRTTSARIWLMGQRDLYVEVTLRGVTGAATVGKLVRREKQP